MTDSNKENELQQDSLTASWNSSTPTLHYWSFTGKRYSPFPGVIFKNAAFFPSLTGMVSQPKIPFPDHGFLNMQQNKAAPTFHSLRSTSLFNLVPSRSTHPTTAAGRGGNKQEYMYRYTHPFTHPSLPPPPAKMMVMKRSTRTYTQTHASRQHHPG